MSARRVIRAKHCLQEGLIRAKTVSSCGCQLGFLIGMIVITRKKFNKDTGKIDGYGNLFLEVGR